MVSMFEFAKPALEELGVKPAANWDETRKRIRLQAEAQLRRKNLSSAATVKWHRLGALAGAGRRNGNGR